MVHSKGVSWLWIAQVMYTKSVSGGGPEYGPPGALRLVKYLDND